MTHTGTPRFSVKPLVPIYPEKERKGTQKRNTLWLFCPGEPSSLGSAQDTDDPYTTVLSMTGTMVAQLLAPSQGLAIRPQDKGNIDAHSRGWEPAQLECLPSIPEALV